MTEFNEIKDNNYIIKSEAKHHYLKCIKPTDQMDSWLDSIDFYRKHIARDASSFYRCVAEHIFFTQVYHTMVRKHCIDLAINNPDFLSQFVEYPVEEYLSSIRNPRTTGGVIEMNILSLLYEVDFEIYKEIGKPPLIATNNGFDRLIVLSATEDDHYDTVYTKTNISSMAFVQSYLYENLYKNVFRLEEVYYAVEKMLHDKSARYEKELNAAFFMTGFEMRLEMRDNCKNVKDLLDSGITPFPYKVAKSLDASIYRNVEYDTWNELRKVSRHNNYSWSNNELLVGCKCVVNITDGDSNMKYHAYIQDLSPNKGPVLVFVEQLGKKITVPYENLELLPKTSNELNDLDDKVTRLPITNDGNDEYQSAIISSSFDEVNDNRHGYHQEEPINEYRTQKCIQETPTQTNEVTSTNNNDTLNECKPLIDFVTTPPPPQVAPEFIQPTGIPPSVPTIHTLETNDVINASVKLQPHPQKYVPVATAPRVVYNNYIPQQYARQMYCPPPAGSYYVLPSSNYVTLPSQFQPPTPAPIHYTGLREGENVNVGINECSVPIYYENVLETCDAGCCCNIVPYAIPPPVVPPPQTQSLPSVQLYQDHLNNINNNNNNIITTPILYQQFSSQHYLP